MSLSAGTRLGPYEILAPLGAGGMGEVYRARDPRMGREVAVAAPCIRAEPLSRARNALFIDELKLDRACDLFNKGYLESAQRNDPFTARRNPNSLPTLVKPPGTAPA